VRRRRGQRWGDDDGAHAGTGFFAAEEHPAAAGALLSPTHPQQAGTASPGEKRKLRAVLRCIVADAAQTDDVRAKAEAALQSLVDEKYGSPRSTSLRDDDLEPICRVGKQAGWTEVTSFEFAAAAAAIAVPTARSSEV
jgi:hypothetical protein